MDEFHSIFRRGSCRATLGSTVDTYSASARGWLLVFFRIFLRGWVESDPEVFSSLFSFVATLVVNNGSGMPVLHLV